MADPALIGFAAIVGLGYLVQTVSGFGSMIVCVTLGAHLFPIPHVVTLAVPVSLLQTGYIVLRHHDGIDWTLLSRRVFPLMGSGVAVGYLAFSGVGGAAILRPALGVMVLVLASRELWLLRRADAGEARADRGPAVSNVAMVGAGIIHGIYATGGPLLVYALGREDLPKHRFRSSLSTIWLVLNAGLALAFLSSGRYDPATAGQLLWLVPAVPVGIALGELVHRRVEERPFKIAVFGLLIVAALTLFIPR